MLNHEEYKLIRVPKDVHSLLAILRGRWWALWCHQYDGLDPGISPDPRQPKKFCQTNLMRQAVARQLYRINQQCRAAGVPLNAIHIVPIGCRLPHDPMCHPAASDTEPVRPPEMLGLVQERDVHEAFICDSGLIEMDAL